MIFIEENVYINPSHVSLLAKDSGMTRIVFTNGRHITVRRTVEAVSQLINEAL